MLRNVMHRTMVRALRQPVQSIALAADEFITWPIHP